MLDEVRGHLANLTAETFLVISLSPAEHLLGVEDSGEAMVREV